MNDPKPANASSTEQPIQVEVAARTAFSPTCSDCRYDLAGLPDGRCPECGLAFTRASLERLWLAKQARNRAVPMASINAVLLIMMVAPTCLTQAMDVQVLATVLVWYTALLTTFLIINRDRWIAYSHLLIFFLVPLLVILPTVAATPIGLYAATAIAMIAAVICWLALKWSPLTSAIVLLVLFAVPLAGFGALMFTMALEDIAAGRYWSSLDKPTPFGWVAMPAPLARQAGVLIIGVAIVIGAIITAYARRALVRLKARSKRENPPSPAARA